MNVYDFDNTILRGDSTARFFAWCLRRCPRMWLDAPGQIGNAALFLLKRRAKQAFKERMLSFLARVDVERELARFWQKNLSRVKPFYREKHCADDVVISASPEFLIRPACEALGIRHVLGSPVDMHTAVFPAPTAMARKRCAAFIRPSPAAKLMSFTPIPIPTSPWQASPGGPFWCAENKF